MKCLLDGNNAELPECVEVLDSNIVQNSLKRNRKGTSETSNHNTFPKTN